jgi:hypothetical protein
MNRMAILTDGNLKSDFPYTFYFNGVGLPKWAQVWHACKFPIATTPGSMEIEIDHVGGVASADAITFRTIALQLVGQMIQHEETILANCTEYLALYVQFKYVPANEIFSGVRDGLMRMIDLATQQNIAFWTAGNEENRVRLLDFMRRHRLPREYPDFFEAPHVRSKQMELRRGYEVARGTLIQLLHHGSLPKSMRKWIHNLPNSPVLGPG